MGIWDKLKDIICNLDSSFQGCHPREAAKQKDGWQPLVIPDNSLVDNIPFGKSHLDLSLQTPADLPRAIPSDLWDRAWKYISYKSKIDILSPPKASNSYWRYLESYASMPINNLQKEPRGSVKRKKDVAEGSQRLNQRLQLAISISEEKQNESCNIFCTRFYLVRWLKTKYLVNESKDFKSRTLVFMEKRYFWKILLSK